MPFTIDGKNLTLRAAQHIAAAARIEAAQRGVTVTVAVLDAGAHPLVLERMDGVHAATVDVALAKARSAAMFRRPTATFAAGIAAGNVALMSLPHVVPFPGGEPLRQGELFVGAIGISGAAPEIDQAIAEAGVAAFMAGDAQP